MATYSGSLRVRQVIDLPTEPPCACTISLIAWASRSRPGVEPVDLDDQHGAGLDRKAEAERHLDRPDHQVVEHLERGRHDPRGDDPAHRLGGRVDRIEDGQQSPARLGVARQVHDRLGDDAKGPLVAHDQPGQVVAGVVFGDPAGLDHRAVGHDERRPLDVVDRHAVLERVRPARVGRDIAADRAGPLARRVGRIMKPGPGQRARQPDVDDARSRRSRSGRGCSLRGSASSASGRSSLRRRSSACRPPGSCRPLAERTGCRADCTA